MCTASTGALLKLFCDVSNDADWSRLEFRYLHVCDVNGLVGGMAVPEGLLYDHEMQLLYLLQLGQKRLYRIAIEYQAPSLKSRVHRHFESHHFDVLDQMWRGLDSARKHAADSGPCRLVIVRKRGEISHEIFFDMFPRLALVPEEGLGGFD